MNNFSELIEGYKEIAKTCLKKNMDVKSAMKYMTRLNPNFKEDNFQKFFPTIFALEEFKKNK